MSQSRSYPQGFFSNQCSGSRQSAAEAVPVLLQWISVSSVVDVGCGVGAWLSVFREHGIADLLGLDGDYVDRKLLLIPPTQFRAVDLTTPPALGRTFDLAVSIEVAEHLPAEVAERFVEYLVGLAPLVLFSAAIPGQGGTHHVNEQWPDYWASRFRQHGFLTIDCLRPILWRNDRVQWWHAQNILLFAAESRLERHPALHDLAARTDLNRLAMVHPRAYSASRHETEELRRRSLPGNIPGGALIRYIPTILRSIVKRRLS